MASFQRFQDDGYKNWIKITMGLQYLKTRLGLFLENETETYHRSLRNEINRGGRNIQECQIKCDFKKGDLKKWIPSQKVPPTCPACAPWRDVIGANHSLRGANIVWNNSTPYLWPSEKWEVAKVYMARGNTNHKTVGDFDISAFLNLMTNCKHFKQFGNNNLISKVTNVRNQVMHSATFQVKPEDLQSYLDRIKDLGKALGKHSPALQALANEIDELQNINFDLMLRGAEAQGTLVESQRLARVQEFLSMELNIMKDKMECLTQREDGDQILTLEDLQCVKGFLEGNQDLQERLMPEWERLKEVQEQHGQQLESLTGRVEDLEKTLTPEQQSEEFSTAILMYKNYLFEDARKNGWPEPVFSEKREGTGSRGQVVIKGRTFTGLQVCRSKVQAHQEVAKIALDQLAKETASDRVDVEASVSQTHQSESVSPPGSSFFGSVTVVLDTEVVPGEACPGVTKEAVESTYKKLAPLFGLELSASASSYREAVLGYCQKRDIPRPKENRESDRFSLRVSGPITFHDQEGSSKKKQAHRQAAKVALLGLCGVLGKKEALDENYVGALKELLDAKKLKKASYDVTPRAEGAGGGGRSVGDQEKDGEGGRSVGDQERDGEGGRIVGDQERDGQGGGREDAVDELLEGEKGTGGGGQSADNLGPESSRTDATVSTETQAGPAAPEERSISGDSGKFLGSVKVAIKKDLSPCEASSQEGAVEAAYRSLLLALSLGSSAGGEKKSVVEFFTQIKCRPPVEQKVTTAEGIHRCTLKINGELIFQSPEGAVKRQPAEQLAAKEALRRLGGLLGGSSTNLAGEKNCKGKLQELLAKHGGPLPEYSFTERPTLGTGTALCQVTEISSVIGSSQQADVPSVSHAVTVDSAHKDSEPPLCTKWAPTDQGPKPLKTDTPVSMETQATLATPEERSIAGDSGKFLGLVKVAIKKDLSPCEASSQEGAVEAAYRSLLLALSLGSSAGGEKQSVMEFFTQIKCRPPVEQLVTTAEGIHRCTLKINGELIFQSPEGAVKRQPAEQLAAKEALRRLGGLLGGSSTNLAGEKNCKGKLQELLVKHGGPLPEYSFTERPTLGTGTAPGQVTEVSSVIGSSQQADVPSVSHALTVDSAHKDSEPPPSKRFAKMQSDGTIKEVRRCLSLLGLRPPSVVCESVGSEQLYEWSVHVSFECFTFQNHKLFDSKKEASRSSYLTLGLAGQFCQPDETKAKERVIQFFSKRSFPLPKEVLGEPEPLKFSCSLTGITCVFTYTAKDSSEASARHSASHRALSCISPLIGSCVLAPSSSMGTLEPMLKTVLEGVGLKLSNSIHVEHRSSATLRFSEYCMETKGESSKKETRNKLSQRLLTLLQGQETLATSKDQSMKYVLGMWFSKSHLDPPVFEDTDDKFGTRVTFSAPLHCSYTDWQASQEEAERRLVEELKRRVLNLIE